MDIHISSGLWKQRHRNNLSTTDLNAPQVRYSTLHDAESHIEWSWWDRWSPGGGRCYLVLGSCDGEWQVKFSSSQSGFRYCEKGNYQLPKLAILRCQTKLVCKKNLVNFPYSLEWNSLTLKPHRGELSLTTCHRPVSPLLLSGPTVLCTYPHT